MTESGCGCDLGWDDYRAAFDNFPNRIKSEAAAIAGELSGMNEGEVTEALYSIMCGYKECLVGAELLERAPIASQRLKDVSDQALALLNSMQQLGHGAMRCILRETRMHDGQWVNAQPWEIPTKAIYGKPHGSWGARLIELADLTKVAAESLDAQIQRGGRIPFTKRLDGNTPEEELAKECMALAKKHGCKSQAVVQRMVQAIMETEKGKRHMTRMDGKPAAHKGRKAVRKVAQTKRDSGPV